MATWKTAIYGPAPVLDRNSNPIPNVRVTVCDLNGTPAPLPSGSSFVYADRAGNLTFYGPVGSYQLNWINPDGTYGFQIVTTTVLP